MDDQADLAAAWREIGAGLVEAIDDPACAAVQLPTPVGPMPFAEVVEALPEDVLIHTWDLARATGGAEQLDAEAVMHVFEKFRPLDEVLRQPWAFGPKITPAAGCRRTDRIPLFRRPSAVGTTGGRRVGPCPVRPGRNLIERRSTVTTGIGAL